MHQLLGVQYGPRPFRPILANILQGYCRGLNLRASRACSASSSTHRNYDAASNLCFDTDQYVAAATRRGAYVRIPSEFLQNTAQFGRVRIQMPATRGRPPAEAIPAALSQNCSSSIRVIGHPAAISAPISRAMLRLLTQSSAVGSLAIIGQQW